MTVQVDNESWPGAFFSPSGHWAAAASWLQAWARWFWVLVHIAQRAASEQSLRLPASGKEGDLYCRQAQVSSYISLNWLLPWSGGWENCSDWSLCFLFSSLLFSNFLSDVSKACTTQEWGTQAIQHNFTLQFAKSMLLLIPRRTKVPFLQIVLKQRAGAKEVKLLLLLHDAAVFPTKLCWSFQGSSLGQRSPSLLGYSLMSQKSS